MKAITLKAGREKSALRYHPWIFSGAIDEVIGDPELGETVEVYSFKSDFLGLAAYSPKSQIRGRFWTFGEKANIDREFFSDILDRAIAARKSRGFDIEDKESAFRLINAENDGIPGCIIDKYADIYSVEILAAGDEVRNDLRVACRKDALQGHLRTLRFRRAQKRRAAVADRMRLRRSAR